MEDEINIPTYFVCPISLEMMTDPVTVSTGITYDRDSIERWIFSNKSETCPVTKTPLSVHDSIVLTPNHNLRRLIQAWCITNLVHERIPTSKSRVDETKIDKLIEEARRSQSEPHQVMLLTCLQKLKAIATESDANRRCMEASGVAIVLASIINNSYNKLLALVDADEYAKAGDEAIEVLSALQLTEKGLKRLIEKDLDFVITLTKVLRIGKYQSRAYAALLLKSLFKVLDQVQLIGMKAEIFVDVVHMLKQQISNQATKAALQILIELCPWGRNRIKAVEAGAVHVMVELLLEGATEKRVCEMGLVTIDLLCGCAEGRAELLKHAAGLAVVSKKMLRVSKVATERAVRIVASIAKFSATAVVLHEMMQVGLVGKICMVLQADCSSKAKEKAKEILALHSRTWRNSPCVPTHLLASYPFY